MTSVLGSGEVLSTERNLQEGIGLNLNPLLIGSRGVLGILGQVIIRAEKFPASLEIRILSIKFTSLD